MVLVYAGRRVDAAAKPGGPPVTARFPASSVPLVSRDVVRGLRDVGGLDATAFDHGLIVLSTQPTRDGFAGDQTLFAPAFTATDEELGEMVSRFADVVHEVAKDVEPELEQEPIWSGGGG